MATLVLTDAFFSINAVDLSDHVKSVSIDYSAEMLDDTAMGDTTRSSKGGLKDWTMSVEFHQDYAASNVDATIFSLVGVTTAIIVRADNTAGVSATNPNYTGTGIVENYQPVAGAVGDLAAVPISIKAASTLTRATS